MIKIGVFCDHGGYALKEELLKCTIADVIFKDYGTYSNDSVDYPEYSVKAAVALKNEEIDNAILICGSGIGICIGVNRFPWVRAFVAHSNEEARLARGHNDANAICFAGRLQSIKDILPILETFLSTPFEGGRHQRRVDMLSQNESVT